MSYLGTGNKYINFFKSDMGIIILFSLVKLFLHLYTNIFAGYGIFRDELYYLSCATRPDLGYVDQPPFSIWVLTVVKTLLGNSVFAIRLAPAFIGSLTLYFSGRITNNCNSYCHTLCPHLPRYEHLLFYELDRYFVGGSHLFPGYPYYEKQR